MTITRIFFLFAILPLFYFTSIAATTETTGEAFDCAEFCAQQFSKLKKYASHGSPKAQTLLALAYKSGDGIEADEDQAWRWIRKARRQAFPPALHIVSQWYRRGYATEIDIEKADKFLQRSADQNFGPAILDLGILNYQKHNDEKAKQLFEKAATMGSKEAKQLLAIFNPPAVVEVTAKDAINKIEETKPAIPRQHHKDDEVLEIYASSAELFQLMDIIILGIKEEGVYDTASTTGSRIGGRRCGQGGPDCRMLKGREARQALQNFQDDRR